jgi:hypothetical protein
LSFPEPLIGLKPVFEEGVGLEGARVMEFLKKKVESFA